MSRKRKNQNRLLQPLLSVSPDVLALFVVVGFVCFYVAGSLAANAAGR